MKLSAAALLLVPALTAACGAKIGGAAQSGVDAAPGGDAPVVDAATGVDAPTTVDAAPACANGRTVFLNFDGVTLTHATKSDATANQASWLGVNSGTVPPYQNGSGTRTQDIQTIVTAVQAYFAADPITVVTTRPTTGPYVMIAFGGTNGPLGTPFTGAVNSLDCGDTVKSDVGWIADVIPLSKVPSYTVGAIGYGLGLTATNDPADCMCGWGNGCNQSNSPCTLSPSITADNRCQSTTQDEVARFQTEFCAP